MVSHRPGPESGRVVLDQRGRRNVDENLCSLVTQCFLCPVPGAEPQPRWGCWPSATLPRVARSSQPWALSWNPVGIQVWKFRKASDFSPVANARRKENRFNGFLTLIPFRLVARWIGLLG